MQCYVAPQRIWRVSLKGIDLWLCFDPLTEHRDTLIDCVTFENLEHAMCWDFRGDNQGTHL